VRLGSATQGLRYTWASRFEEEAGSNPEELLAGALASCFAMALASRLTRNNAPPKTLTATAEATVEKVEGEWTITGVGLHLRGDVPGMSLAELTPHAEAAKAGCPVSRALKAVPITLVVEG
jgi:osmotically inducible protein OsmC